MGYAEDQARRLEEALKSRARVVTGVVTAVDWAASLVTVNMAGLVQAMPWRGGPPWAGDTVRVSYAAGQPTAQLVEGSPQGTVQSVASNIATVLGDDGHTRRWFFGSGLTLTNGDRVALDYARRLAVKLATDTDSGAPAVATPGKAPTTGKSTRTFRPIRSNDYYHPGSRWDTANPTVSEGRSGYYWYGTQIGDTIPDSATVLSAKVSLVELWDNVPGVASGMGYHGQADRGGSPPGLSGGISVSNGGDINIASWASQLRNGTAKGIGFYRDQPSGTNGWRSFADSSRSGFITITWQT